MTDIILTVVAVIVIIFSATFLYFYLLNRKTQADTEDIISSKTTKATDFICLFSAVVSCLIFLYCMFIQDTSIIKAFMNAEVMMWLVIVGYIDFKEKIIPNALIVTGICFWAILTTVDILVAQSSVKQVLLYSLVGGLLCGGILFSIAIIVKTALGMGDVKMFTVLGLLYGVSNTYSILLFSMVLMAIVSIVLLILKKVTKKTAVPMAPFVVVGFLICVLGGI